MGWWLRSCLQSVLKLVNSVMGLAGMGVILYSLWMLRSWYKHIDGSSFAGPVSSPPWFIFAFLGLGIYLCLITCSGHIAAETANGHCLSCVDVDIVLLISSFTLLVYYLHDLLEFYGFLKPDKHIAVQYMAFVFLLVLLEAALIADIFLNREWEEDFPEDPTGKFDELKNFVRSNFEMCKWIGLLVVAAQAFSIFMAMVLRALGPDNSIDYDSDDGFVPARLPLLRNKVQQTYQTAAPSLSLKIDS
ncbi:Tetraspanin family [Musa troglodytarum]|uniref:Tetraspanin family n=1 Tax=Musa troglodytarum TaxID=320322 RepID=A0A9E7EX80_9LILI|nr:Tetraspanin family [Musa troglodytarum]